MAAAKINDTWEFLKIYNVETVSCLPTNLMCMLCNKILINARQTPCGCRFCADCISKEFRYGNKKCPGGTEDCLDEVLRLNEDITCDNNANREISKLLVKCPNHQCPFEDELRRMVIHVGECEYFEQLCSKCHQTILKRNIDVHLLRECDLRELPCEFCGKSFTNFDLRTIHNNVQHDRLCDNYRSTCPNYCGLRNSIVIKPHLAVCVNRPEPCPFATIGCSLVNIARQQMNEHLVTESHSHAKSIVTYIDNLNNEIKALKLANTAKQSTIDQLRAATRILDQKVLEPRHNDFIWKVEQFSKCLKNAVDGRTLFVVSKPFLTDRYGYKMSLKLFPNGEGGGLGQYLSLYFIIEPGKYDDLLPFPFKGTMTFTLINCTGQDDYVKTVNITTLSPESSGAGCVKFFEIAQLGQQGFLKNDNLYIKCAVD